MYKLSDFPKNVVITTAKDIYRAEVVGEFKVGIIPYLELDVKGYGYLVTDGECIGALDNFDTGEELEDIIDASSEDAYDSFVESQIDLIRDSKF